MSDLYSQYKIWNALFDGWYDSIGIACSSHKDFEQFCVLDFGRNVKPLHKSQADQDVIDEAFFKEVEIQKSISQYIEAYTNRDLATRGDESPKKTLETINPQNVQRNKGHFFKTPEEEENNPFFDEEFDWEQVFNFPMPCWWEDHSHVDWDFLWENRRRTALLQTPSFSLPHNP